MLPRAAHDDDVAGRRGAKVVDASERVAVLRQRLEALEIRPVILAWRAGISMRLTPISTPT
jgi:hypothetical protein